jgi:SAM-dependent methyltransferase
MSTEKPFTDRFCGRAGVYSKYRPRYPREIVRVLQDEFGFDKNRSVADVGSGTGLLAEIFLHNGNRVFGVEPNPEMRYEAENNLSQYPNFVSINGTAERTGLDSESVDVVSVGQALHWFDPVKTGAEFSRILVNGGYVVIVYNERLNSDGLMRDYNALVEKNAVNVAKVPEIDDSYLSKFFALGFKKFDLKNSQLLDADGLIGRASSASYFPKPNEPGYSRLREDLFVLFQKYEKSGNVEFLYETRVFVGFLK